MPNFVEADWKHFRAIVVPLRERYLAERNARLNRILNDSQKTETERFWAAQEMMETEAKALRRCLDGHTRSSMGHFLMIMREVGMIRLEDMEGFSEDLRQRVYGDCISESP